MASLRDPSRTMSCWMGSLQRLSVIITTGLHLMRDVERLDTYEAPGRRPMGGLAGNLAGHLAGRQVGNLAGNLAETWRKPGRNLPPAQDGVTPNRKALAAQAASSGHCTVLIYFAMLIQTHVHGTCMEGAQQERAPVWAQP